ncbi:hypothetical protein FRC14_003493 [Serendipita sp. 396]|nr:hypothetical protein FRC14_003493 [Serendipita sp. 396]
MKPYWLYFFAFVIVLIGLVTYFWHTPPESGPVNAVPPAYLQKTKKQEEEMEEGSLPMGDKE